MMSASSPGPKGELAVLFQINFRIEGFYGATPLLDGRWEQLRVRKDDRLRQGGEADRIAAKTVFIIKRN